MLTVSRRRLVGLSALAVLAGCSLRPDADAAGRVAQQFHEALTASDRAAACALLAPGTREELESAADESCDDAIGDEGLPSAKSGRTVAAYVRGAIVTLDADVVFVALYGDEWLVTAAGCARGAGKSYDCTVKGG